VKDINTTAFIVALVVTLGYYFFSRRKWSVEDKIVNDIVKGKSKKR
jgi:hypothetical protein